MHELASRHHLDRKATLAGCTYDACRFMGHIGYPAAAPQCKCHAGLRKDDVYRSLRLLVNNGVFEALPGKPTLFRNNAVSATLREGHPTRMQYWVGTHEAHSLACMMSA